MKLEHKRKNNVLLVSNIWAKKLDLPEIKEEDVQFDENAQMYFVDMKEIEATDLEGVHKLIREKARERRK